MCFQSDLLARDFEAAPPDGKQVGLVLKLHKPLWLGRRLNVKKASRERVFEFQVQKDRHQNQSDILQLLTIAHTFVP